MIQIIIMSKLWKLSKENKTREIRKRIYRTREDSGKTTEKVFSSELFHFNAFLLNITDDNVLADFARNPYLERTRSFLSVDFQTASFDYFPVPTLMVVSTSLPPRCTLEPLEMHSWGYSPSIDDKMAVPGLSGQVPLPLVDYKLARTTQATPPAALAEHLLPDEN